MLPRNPAYRTHADNEKDIESERVRIAYEMECLSSSATAFDRCTHPESMHNECTNSCVACGVSSGTRVAQSTERLFGGSYCHTLSSADASAAARKRRKMISAHMQKSTVCFPCDREMPPAAKIDIKLPTVSRVQPMTVSMPKRNAAYPADWRAKCVQIAVSEMFKHGTPEEIIPSGAFVYSNASYSSFEPCPRAREMVALGEDPLEISRRVVEEVYNVVVENPDHFNTTQRRRLHHLTSFVALIVAHLRVVHADKDGTENECLELDRVLAGSKPSQCRYVRRALVNAASDRMEVSPTCATRLVQEAHALAFGGASE